MERARSTTIAEHAYAVSVAGYTVMPAQVGKADLDELRLVADRAAAAARAARQAGQQLKYTNTDEYYDAVRCLYCWGEACIRLLEHDALHALATALMQQYHLWDMELLSALPLPPGATKPPFGWHRDREAGSEIPDYLWCFVCLDDVTGENGATWIMPGSHRLSAIPAPALDGVAAGPACLQLCGHAGDVVVMNPAALHSVGHNRTLRPRRLLLLGLGAAQTLPLLDHWAIAGPTIQQRTSERVRMMLGAARKEQGLDRSWTVLPEGWLTADPVPAETVS